MYEVRAVHARRPRPPHTSSLGLKRTSTSPRQALGTHASARTVAVEYGRYRSRTMESTGPRLELLRRPLCASRTERTARAGGLPVATGAWILLAARRNCRRSPRH